VLPHAPQFASFCATSTHTPLHVIWPMGQPHLPPLHVAPVAHGWLQPPQWSLLVSVSVQTPLHASSAPGHWHAPLLQL